MRVLLWLLTRWSDIWLIRLTIGLISLTVRLTRWPPAGRAFVVRFVITERFELTAGIIFSKVAPEFT